MFTRQRMLDREPTIGQMAHRSWAADLILRFYEMRGFTT